MLCINCFSNTSVTNSRPHKNRPHIWRRRFCRNCETTFTTYERPALGENKLIKSSSGKSIPFNLGRLIISISKSFTHSPKDAAYNSLWLAQTVEDMLSAQTEDITTYDIEATTHQALKRFDEMAAMQYAIAHQLIASTRRRGRPSLS
jgi:transcriptional regulator NrdR family protein